jgi:hypothetical protein
MILIVNAGSSKDVTKNVVGVYFVGQDVIGQKLACDKFTHIQGDYKQIVQNPNPFILPIFGSNQCYYSKWNASMEKLTRWEKNEVFFTIFYILLRCPFRPCLSMDVH